jgi:phosphatidylglycerophosphatase A
MSAEKTIPHAALLKHPVHCLSLGFGSGLAPHAPGTCGTLAGVLIYLLLQSLTLPAYLAVVLVMFGAGIWLCNRTSALLGTHDHGAIVWDEIVGFLVAMILAPTGWLWIGIGFVLFRLFDILKPWPICWLDKHVTGGFGIMLDDLSAGVLSAVCLQIIAYLL